MDQEPNLPSQCQISTDPKMQYSPTGIITSEKNPLSLITEEEKNRFGKAWPVLAYLAVWFNVNVNDIYIKIKDGELFEESAMRDMLIYFKCLTYKEFLDKIEVK